MEIGRNEKEAKWQMGKTAMGRNGKGAIIVAKWEKWGRNGKAGAKQEGAKWA
jgi:hypothetical protein